MDALGLTGSRDWRRWVAIVATAATALVTACGGGGGGDEPASSGGSSGGATSASSVAWAAGPISGLGSIIVNGVRYDDSSARVEDDDGNVRGSGDLKVGMVVELRSSSVNDSTQRASASQIRFGSEIVGPIESIDASSITVLGQPIDISSTTVFDDSLGSGLGALTVGTVVEVHALLDTTTGRYAATRIEDKPAATIYRLRGIVSQLDATAKTFKLGAALISYASATQVPSDLADGQRVRVTLQTAQAGGAWVAISVRSGLNRVDDASDGRIHGTVTAFRSSSDFDVNGVRVDASGAEFKPNASAVVQGAFVRVKGQVANGVLVAREVKVDGRRSDDSIGEVEIHGSVAGLDTGALTFTVRDVKVDYSGSIDWHDGSAANLANGKAVEVKGVWSSDHSTLKATKIEFES